jgi:hypothetical protein
MTAALQKQHARASHLHVEVVGGLPLLWWRHHERAADLARHVGAKVDAGKLQDLLMHICRSVGAMTAAGAGTGEFN